MKVSIGTNVKDGPWGGGNLFAINLTNYLVNKNHKFIEQFVIKKLPVVQNLIIEEDNFINERGKILHNGVVSINLILNKQFDIIKFQISDKGFPFSYNKEAIQDEIKDILLNKILFIKEEIDENSLSGLVAVSYTHLTLPTSHCV